MIEDLIGPGPLLYLAPHCDDAAFSSAGLLHACSSRAIEVRIVTCFSRSAHARSGLGSDPAVVTRAREEEDRRFLATLPGPAHVRWLGLDDAPLRPAHRGRHPCKETSMTAEDQALGEQIERSLADELAHASCVLAPLGLGRHIDHLIVRDLGVRLARRGRARVVLWEDLPYAGRVTLTALEREIEATVEEIGLPLQPRLLHAAQLEAHKQAALACYPSQVIEVHRSGVLGHLRRLARDGSAAERLWAAPLAHAGRSSTAL